MLQNIWDKIKDRVLAAVGARLYLWAGAGNLTVEDEDKIAAGFLQAMQDDTAP